MQKLWVVSVSVLVLCLTVMAGCVDTADEDLDETNGASEVIALDAVSVRVQADTGASPVFTIAVGDRVTVSESDDGWVKVTDDRGTGWARSEHLVEIERLNEQIEQRVRAELDRAYEQGITTMPHAIVTCMELFAVADGDVAESVVSKMLELQQQMKDEAYDMLFPEVSDYYVAAGHDVHVFDNVEMIADVEVRSVVTFLHECGYQITAREGMVEVMISPEFVRELSQLLAGSYGDYLELLATDIDTPVVIDGALQVSWDELASRAVAYERVSDELGASEADVSRDRARRYMTFYLRGVDNTSLFDETGTLVSGIKDSYEQFVEMYPDSRFSEEVSAWLDVLEEANYTRTDAVIEYMQRPLPW